MVLNFIEVIVFLWLIGITIAVYKIVTHYTKITKNGNGTNLQAVLEDVMKKQENLITDSLDNKKRLSALEGKSVEYLQKLSVIRFNPFKDTGGNQSFAVALLNGQGNGMILSNLYARTGSRWYMKTIKAGKSTEIELSKEEEEAINKALKS